MTNKLVIIQKGESLPFKFDRGGASIEGWTCQIKVKQKPTDLPEIERDVPADDDRAFSGFLSKTDTINLPNEGLWYLIGVLTNLSTDEQEEIPIRFQLSKTWSIPSLVANVTFVPPAGDFVVSVMVTLETSTVGATIHFTEDGTDPTRESPTFSNPILVIFPGITIKAFAVKLGFIDSDVTEAIYDVAEGFPTISGLFSRYDLEEPGVVETGTGISLIPDISANSHDLIQGTDSARPSFNQTGIKFADFNGTSDFMDTILFPEGEQSQPNTTVIIFRAKSLPATNQFIHDGDQPTGKRHLLLITAVPLFNANAGTSVNFSSTPDLLKNNIAIVWDGTNARGYVNGGADQLPTSVGTQGLTKLIVGANGAAIPVGFAAIEFYQFVMYDRALSNSELNQIGQFYEIQQGIPYTPIV